MSHYSSVFTALLLCSGTIFSAESKSPRPLRTDVHQRHTLSRAEASHSLNFSDGCDYDEVLTVTYGSSWLEDYFGFYGMSPEDQKRFGHYYEKGWYNNLSGTAVTIEEYDSQNQLTKRFTESYYGDSIVSSEEEFDGDGAVTQGYGGTVYFNGIGSVDSVFYMAMDRYGEEYLSLHCGYRNGMHLQTNTYHYVIESGDTTEREHFRYDWVSGDGSTRDSVEGYLFSSETGTFTLEKSLVCEVDVRDSIVETGTYNYDSTGNIKGGSRNIFGYNSDGNLDTVVTYGMSSGDTIFERDRYSVFYYANDLKVAESSYRIESGAAQESDSTTYSYDAEGHLIKEVRFSYDTFYDGWSFDDSLFYIYDDKNNMVTLIESNSGWRWEYTYDDMNRPVEVALYEFYGSNSALNSTMKIKYSSAGSAVEPFSGRGGHSLSLVQQCDRLTVSGVPTGIVHLSLMTLAGRELYAYSGEIPSQGMVIPLTGVSPGAYVFHCREFNFSRKLLIQ